MLADDNIGGAGSKDNIGRVGSSEDKFGRAVASDFFFFFTFLDDSPVKLDAIPVASSTSFGYWAGSSFPFQRMWWK